MIYFVLVLITIISTTPMLIGYMNNVKNSIYGIITLFSTIIFFVLSLYVINCIKSNNINYDTITSLSLNLSIKTILLRLGVTLSIILWYISLIMALKK